MSCNRYHYDMSLNLDGRLPSGRRDALFTHLDECAPCSALWEEVQRAQELALSLPGERIGDDFHETLWQRIRTGEGTPEAVYLAPAPMLMKVRYVLTGAVAAAAVLIGLSWLTGGSARDVELTGPSRSEVARASDGAPADGPVPTARPDVQFAVQPIDPPSIARASATTVVDSMLTVQRELASVATDDSDDALLRRVRDRLEKSAGRLRGSAECIFWLESENLITVPREVQSELQRLHRGASQLATADAIADVRRAIEDLRRIDMARMAQPFFLRCCDYPEDFPIRFRSHFERNPDARQFLMLEFLAPEPGQFGPATSVLILKSDDRTPRLRTRSVEVEVDAKR